QLAVIIRTNPADCQQYKRYARSGATSRIVIPFPETGTLWRGSMNKKRKLSDVVMDSLDLNPSTEDLARSAYHSRTQFYRLFRALIDETPVAMRRRLLLERAAFQLSHSKASVTDIALDANYGSLEAFTRAFRKAFRMSPSLYRRMRTAYIH